MGRHSPRQIRGLTALPVLNAYWPGDGTQPTVPLHSPLQHTSEVMWLCSNTENGEISLSSSATDLLCGLGQTL